MCFEPVKVFWKNGNSGLVVKEVTINKNYNEFPIAKVSAKGEITKLDIGQKCTHLFSLDAKSLQKYKQKTNSHKLHIY